MRNSLVFIFSIFLVQHSVASIRKCTQEITQAEKNECMLFERDQAIGRLMSEATKYCANKEELRLAKGGTIYPMLLDECLAKELSALAKEFKKRD